MRSGFVGESNNSDVMLPFLRKAFALLRTLQEEALKTAVKFVKASGRNIVTKWDIHMSLIYETHEFFEKDFDAQFLQHLTEENNHTYQTDDEQSDTDDTDEDFLC